MWVISSPGGPDTYHSWECLFKIPECLQFSSALEDYTWGFCFSVVTLHLAISWSTRFNTFPSGCRNPVHLHSPELMKTCLGSLIITSHGYLAPPCCPLAVLSSSSSVKIKARSCFYHVSVFLSSLVSFLDWIYLLCFSSSPWWPTFGSWQHEHLCLHKGQVPIFPRKRSHVVAASSYTYSRIPDDVCDLLPQSLYLGIFKGCHWQHLKCCMSRLERHESQVLRHFIVW